MFVLRILLPIVTNGKFIDLTTLIKKYHAPKRPIKTLKHVTLTYEILFEMAQNTK